MHINIDRQRILSNAPVDQHEKANPGQHDQLPSSAFANVMQASGTDGQAGQQQAEGDQAIDDVALHACGDRDQDLKQKKNDQTSGRDARPAKVAYLDRQTQMV
jgi:hypothetical protein